eukprot:jgi/Botrbrau1/15037/Bobra.320_2s0011.1
MTLTLYTMPRTRGATVEWFLRDFNVPHDIKILETTDENNELKSDWFAEINPFSLVPAIKDGEFNLFETGAILIYLQNKYVESLGIEDLAKIAQWIQVCNSTVEQAMMTKNVDRMQRLLAVIDKQLAGKHFIHGDSFTAADIMLGSLLAWLQMAMPEVDLEKYPEAYRYSWELLERDSCPFRAWPAYEEKVKAKAARSAA